MAVGLVGVVRWPTDFHTKQTEANVITPDTRAALDWIDAHVPEDARVFGHPDGLARYVGGYTQRRWIPSTARGTPVAALAESDDAWTCAMGWRDGCDPLALQAEHGVDWVVADTTAYQPNDNGMGFAGVADLPWINEAARFGDVYVYRINALTTAYPHTFTQPTHVTDHDGWWYVNLQPGRIVRWPAAGGDVEEWADLTEHVFYEAGGPELGLQGLTFSPDGSSAYVTYTGHGDRIVMARMPLRSGRPDVQALEEVVSVDRFYTDDPPEEGNARYVHNGGAMAWGPDGDLYLSVGEGTFHHPPTYQAQDRATALGKVVRVDTEAGTWVRYASGFRNPWRMTWTPDGHLLVTDVGQGTWEEVNDVEPGGNYGWPAMEGPQCYYDARVAIHDREPGPDLDCEPDDYDAPLHAYLHDDGQKCAIIGGPVWGDRYVFSDWCTGQLWALDWRTGDVETIGQVGSMVQSLASGPDGGLYVMAMGDEGWQLQRYLGEHDASE